ncbi:MAG: hypothetical protein ACKVS8_13005 [Phycisphaerales bacterium]
MPARAIVVGDDAGTPAVVVSAEGPTALAAQAWTSLLAQPPDFVAAAAILGRDDAAVLREAKYTVPDKMQDVVVVDSLRVDLASGVGKNLRPVLEGYLAYVKEDAPARAKALVGFDHLLAGIMKSAPVAHMSVVAMATNRFEPAFANVQATLLRGWTLNELAKLGEPAAYHDPARKRDIVNAMARDIAKNQADPNASVP